MTKASIAIIGIGHMGESLLSGLITHGQPRDKLMVTDISEEKLLQVQQRWQVAVERDNANAVKDADVVLLAIKPQVFATVVKAMAPAILARQPLVISIAAGIREATITELLGENTAIVRAMPNTPALIGCGATALHANRHVTAAQRELATELMQAIGIVVWLDDEAKMDAVTAVSGSGPAYFFLVMEAMQAAAVELGLPPDTARLLTLQTALGSARMAMESDASLAELRRRVTSPGGTTEKAISVLEDHRIHAAFKNALQAAKERSEELARILGENK